MHNVQENYRIGYFYHLDYLMAGNAGREAQRNILGLYRNPDRHIDAAPAPGDFVFVGYDLIEEMTQVALTNCGGFPETFNEELNQYGLLKGRAIEVQEIIRAPSVESPNDVRCAAIWRIEGRRIFAADHVV